MSMRNIHTSSATDNWPTPQHLFDRLHEEFEFTIDVAASADNAKCKRYFTCETDGLAQSWANETAFCNPPYGRQIEKWVEKAIQSTYNNATIVMLLPARTDTRWFQACFAYADEVRFIPGRLRFGDAKEPAPFPSCIVVFKPRSETTWAGPAGMSYKLPTRHSKARWVSVQVVPESVQP